MPLEIGISKVYAAIEGTRAPLNLNKKGVKNAKKIFDVFAEKSRETIKEYEEKISALSAQISKLSLEAAEAEEQLRQSTAIIQYANERLANAKKTENKLKERIRHYKERNGKSVTILKNGNTLETESKWNGTTLEVEKTPRGRKIRYTVASADRKTQRSGVFDEMTQRRLSTHTENEKGEVTMSYDIGGKLDKIFNKEPEFPTLVDSNFVTNGKRKILTQVFSDDVTVVTEREGRWGKIEKLGPDGKYMQTIEEYVVDNNKTIVDFKYENGFITSMEETITPVGCCGKNEKYFRKFGYDLADNRYVSEGTAESKAGKLTGAVSKMNKFGELEEFSFKMNCNPDVRWMWNSYKSVDGTCKIVEENGKYKLIPTRYKVTMGNGNEYILTFTNGGSIDRIVNANGGEVIDRNIDAILKYMPLNELFKI